MDEDDTTAIDRVRAGYDLLAEKADTDLDRNVSPWGDSYFQQHYSWPATRAVLPELTDCRVLLAGCGRGDYVGWFHDNGASVTGVDVSRTAIQQARERFDDEATFYHADLTEGLTFADDGVFDLVVSNLVFSHIREWQPVLEEFHRILASDGILVVTTVHPQYIRSGADVGSYYATEKVMNDWPDVEIPTYYRPMNAVITPFTAAGFRLATFDEPKPRDAFEAHYPERYRDALDRPELLVIRARADR